MHIYRWDLDRTYLDTDIHSVRGMVRAAFEPASRKRNVPGAAALLRALIDADPSCRVSIVSGSPVQMREVLEEKLALDGVRFDSLTLKDSLRNIKRGRLKAVRGQVGYKLPALLQGRVGVGTGVGETLFGDDSEVDALVYTLYADALAGRIDAAELARVMEAGNAYEDSVKAAVRAMGQFARADAVQDIFIHVDRGVPLREFTRLGSLVVPVFSWLQAAIVLWLRGRITIDGVARVVQACSEEAQLGARGLGGLLQDLVRRRVVERDDVERLLDEATELEPFAASVRGSLDLLGQLPEPPPPRRRPDYLAFLRSVSQ